MQTQNGCHNVVTVVIVCQSDFVKTASCPFLFTVKKENPKFTYMKAFFI